jgi:hypothetical protein
MPLAMHALMRLAPQVGHADDQRQPQPRRLRVLRRAGVARRLPDYPGRWRASWPAWSTARRRTS